MKKYLLFGWMESTWITRCICDLIIVATVVEQVRTQVCSNRKHVYVCDDPGVYSISCPRRATIRIAYANYGRTELDSVRCSTTQPHNNDVTCSNIANTQSTVQSMCDGKNSCIFNISSDAYSNPDPCVGTYKYLDVEYDCLDPINNCAVICGEDITLSSSDTYTMSSPVSPSLYPNYLDCVWKFTATNPGYIIKIEFLSLIIEGGCADYVYIQDLYSGNDNKLCLEYIHTLSPFLSAGNQMTVLFYTDSSVQLPGFTAKVTSVSKPQCSSVAVPLSQSPATITSLFYPDNYPALYDCQWHFTAPPLFYIAVKFFDIDLENDCSHDYLLIVNNIDNDENRYCGNFTPSASLVLQTTNISIYFKTSYLNSRPGFNISLTAAVDFNECVYDGDNICDDDLNKLASCVNSIGSYTCQCPYTDRGVYWDGSKCTTGRNPDNMCSLQNGLCDHTCNVYTLDGVAVSPVLNFTCSCNSGYQLSSNGRSCVDMNECEVLQPCNSTSLPAPDCDNNVGSYTCTCPTGFIWNISNHVCRDANECDFDNGGCDHMCTNTAGGVQCSCQTGYQLLRNLRSCEDINECASQNGGCQQVCRNSQSSFTCDCIHGYTLNTTDHTTCMNLDECGSANGQCDQICEDYGGSYKCKCTSGYKLAVDERTCGDINECHGHHTCQQICVNQPGSYTCGCNMGYTLDSNNSTCSDVNECSVSNGGCAHLCTNTQGSFQCNCVSGFVLLPDGKNCGDQNECVNVHGCEFKCVNYQGSYQCICDTGYTVNEADNKTCVDVNECDVFNGYCQEYCNNTNGGHVCSCPTGYKLRADGRTCADVDECTDGSHPCQHECVNIMGSYKCVCKAGFVLQSDVTTCNDINECSTFNGGCEQICNNTDGGYICDCRHGYRLQVDGRTCLDYNECQGTTPCKQICINEQGNYRCACDIGYTLDNNSISCTDINECKANSSGCAYQCSNTEGSYKCSCNTGFKLLPDGKNCDDINECTLNTDGCSQTCDNTYGSYKCSCGQGYKLAADHRICMDVNECTNNNGFCQQVCNNTMGSYMCDCSKGYSLNKDGRTCYDVDECGSNILNYCQQKCINMDGSYKCECNNGYQLSSNGYNCTDIDECMISTSGCAQNCTNTPGSYQCSCGSGYLLLSDLKNCVDRNECTSPSGHLCQQTCQNDIGGYRCKCYTGYQLNADTYTCSDVNECSLANPHPQCEQNCTNSQGSFTCSCTDGFTLLGDGKSCEDNNECTRSNPCSYLCINDPGSYHCICLPQYDLHPDGYRCMGPYYYTVQLTLYMTYIAAMADPKSTSFTSIDNSIKANVLNLFNKPSSIGLEDVFVINIANGGDSISIKIRLQFTRNLDNETLSIIIYDLYIGILKQVNILQINGKAIGVTSNIKYIHQFQNGTSKEWDVLSLCHLYDNIHYCQTYTRCESQDGKPVCRCVEGYKVDGSSICVQVADGLSSTYIIIIGSVTTAALIAIIILTAWLCCFRLLKDPEEPKFSRNNHLNNSNHSYAHSIHSEFEFGNRSARNSYRARGRNNTYSGLQWYYWY